MAVCKTVMRVPSNGPWYLIDNLTHNERAGEPCLRLTETGSMGWQFISTNFRAGTAKRDFGSE